MIVSSRVVLGPVARAVSNTGRKVPSHHTISISPHGALSQWQSWSGRPVARNDAHHGTWAKANEGTTAAQKQHFWEWTRNWNMYDPRLLTS